MHEKLTEGRRLSTAYLLSVQLH